MKSLAQRLIEARTPDNELYINLVLRWIAAGVDACVIDGRIETRQGQLEPGSEHYEGWQQVTNIVIAYIAETDETLR